MSSLLVWTIERQRRRATLSNSNFSLSWQPVGLLVMVVSFFFSSCIKVWGILIHCCLLVTVLHDVHLICGPFSISGHHSISALPLFYIKQKWLFLWQIQKKFIQWRRSLRYSYTLNWSLHCLRFIQSPLWFYLWSGHFILYIQQKLPFLLPLTNVKEVDQIRFGQKLNSCRCSKCWPCWSILYEIKYCGRPTDLFL